MRDLHISCGKCCSSDWDRLQPCCPGSSALCPLHQLFFWVSKSQIFVYFASQVIFAIIIFVSPFEILLALPLPLHCHSALLKFLRCFLKLPALHFQGLCVSYGAKCKESTPAETGQLSVSHFSSITHRSRLNFQKEVSSGQPQELKKEGEKGIPTLPYWVPWFSHRIFYLGNSPWFLLFLKITWPKERGGYLTNILNCLLIHQCPSWLNLEAHKKFSTSLWQLFCLVIPSHVSWRLQWGNSQMGS